MFEKLQGSLESTARAVAIAGGAAMTFAAFMVTGDVIARKFFGATMRGSDEITGYIFAASTTWAYAHCVFTRSNIRIDAAYLLAGKRTRALLDVVGLSLLAYYIFLLTGSAYTVVIESWEFNYTAQTPMATPLWIPQAFWFAGLAFMMICLGFLLVRALFLAICRDWGGVNAIAGVRSLEQEVAEETHVEPRVKPV